MKTRILERVCMRVDRQNITHNGKRPEKKLYCGIFVGEGRIVPTTFPRDSQEFVSFHAVLGAPQTLVASEPAGAVDGKESRLAVGLPRAKDLNNPCNRVPTVLDIVEEPPLIGDGGKLPKLPRVLKPKVGGVVHNWTCSSLLHCVLQERANDGIARILVGRVKPLATIYLDVINVPRNKVFHILLCLGAFTARAQMQHCARNNFDASADVPVQGKHSIPTGETYLISMKQHSERVDTIYAMLGNVAVETTAR